MPALRERIDRALESSGGKRLLKSALGGAGALVGIRIASMGLAFGLHMLLARILGASEYGNYSYAAAWVAFLQVIAAFGLPDSSIRFISAYRAGCRWDQLKGFLRHSTNALFFTTTATGLLFAIGVWLYQSKLDQSSADVLYVAALSTPAVTFAAVWSARLRGLKRVAESAAPMDLFHPIVFGGLFLLCAPVFSIDPTGADAMLAHGVGALSAFVLTAFLFRRSLPTELSGASLGGDGWEWTRVSAPLMAMSLLVMARARSATLLVGLYLQSAEVGYFAAANRVSSLTSFGAMAIAIWAAPFISELHMQNDKAGLQRLVRLSTRAGSLMMLPMGLILIVFGREVLALFGAEFQEAYHALVILTLGQLLNAATGPVGFLMTMTGNQTAATGIEILSTALQLGLVVALMPVWGIEGAAFGAAIATGFRNLAMFFLAWRLTGIRSSIV